MYIFVSLAVCTLDSNDDDDDDLFAHMVHGDDGVLYCCVYNTAV